MSEHDKRRTREIDTPMGNVVIVEKLWNEGGEDERWSYVQRSAPPQFDSLSTGDVLGYYVKKYAVSRQLVEEGYRVEDRLDDRHLLWTKY